MGGIVATQINMKARATTDERGNRLLGEIHPRMVPESNETKRNVWEVDIILNQTSKLGDLLKDPKFHMIASHLIDNGSLPTQTCTYGNTHMYKAVRVAKHEFRCIGHKIYKLEDHK